MITVEQLMKGRTVEDQEYIKLILADIQQMSGEDLRIIRRYSSMALRGRG